MVFQQDRQAFPHEGIIVYDYDSYIATTWKGHDTDSMALQSYYGHDLLE